MASGPDLKRVVILGGGFGGVYASRRLGPQVRGRTADVTLVSRDNYFVMTPLLFEAASGVIEFRHAVNPVRPLLADNVAAVLAGKEPRPFVYKNKGTMAALGHRRGIADPMGLPVWGFAAWWVWRTYHLMQMPRWERRLRIMADWAVGLLFRPDTAKIDLTPDPAPLAAPEADAGEPAAAEAVSA